MENILMPYKQEYELLNAARQNTRTYSKMSLWPEWAPDEKIDVPTIEFWKLSSLFQTIDGLNAEPYKSTITLDNLVRAYTPNKMKEKNPERMSKMASQHFRVLDDKKFDAELTRFAAWALFKEIGKTKPTIFHQEYFLAPNNTAAMEIYKNALQTARIGLRDNVRKYQKQLNGIMNKLHAQNKHYAELNREMTKWLFGNLNAADIQYEYKLPDNKPLADFMNAHLLAAYGNALENIVHKWDFEVPAREYSILRGVAYNEMIAARKDMQKKFGNPEHNFVRSVYNSGVSVDEVEKWHNKREFEFARAHLNDHVR